MSKRSIKRIAQQARTVDAKARQEAFKTDDSFQNFAAALGVGTRNVTSAGTYGLNPISRQRIILDWIHRGSWIGGVAVDLVANDMTRAGADILGDMKPEDVEHLERAATTWNIWNAVNSTIKWARLYGGCIAVMMIDGQKPETPLNIDRVAKGAFKGLLVLDRWMITPSLEDLVTEMGPDMGLPKYYSVDASAGVPSMKVHYSRVMRLTGIELPYWQRVAENLWGISVLERLYDRMLAFDSATQGAAQLVYKCYIRTYKVKNMRAAIAAGGDAVKGLVNYTEFMRRMQGIEGITMLDADDDFVAQQVSAFSGLSEALIQFGQQLSGALQIPLVRLFGQSPAGLNSSGDSDLRTYYDNINNQQNATLMLALTKIYRVMAQSEGVKIGEGFRLKFRSLWLLNDGEKADIATKDAATVNSAFQSGIIRRDTALKELKQSSQVTGRFTNISDDEIKEAEQEPSQFEQQQAAIEFEQEQARNQNGPDGEEESKGKKKTKDAESDVNYKKSSDPEKHCCGICKYRDERLCLNAKVQDDPRVPENENGDKVIQLTYGCAEFEKK